MQVYCLCLVVVTFAAYLGQSVGNRRQIAYLWISVAFVTMVLVAGLRASSVGTDTGGYTRTYESDRTVSDVWERSAEPGYLILSIAAHRISHAYWAILTAVAAVVVFCYMRAIYKFSVNPAISLFVFITMGYYTFFFNGARQGIAAAVYCLAFGGLIEGKFRRYALWVMIACLFHRSAILTLPLYFLFRRKCSLWYVVGIIVAAAIVVHFFSWFLSVGVLVSEKYSFYLEHEASGARWLTLFYVLLCVFFLMFKPAVSPVDRRVYDCFLNMLIFGATIYVVVRWSGGYIELTRCAFYFQVASVFLWPIVFKNVRAPSRRPFLNSDAFLARQRHVCRARVFSPVHAGFPIHAETTRTSAYMESIPVVLGHLVYFYIFLSQIGGATPYHLNEELARYLFG